MSWQDLFSYYPLTGNLIWKVRPKHSSVVVGASAGCVRSDGYLTVRFKGKDYRSHRVIWELVNGPIPEGLEVDHINHNRSDNRIANLRLVTRTDNNRNKTREYGNVTGVTGVRFNHNGWEVQITANNIQHYLGRFKTLFEAAAARKSAEMLYNYHSNHGM